MSELAERERLVKRGWAAPGGAHDHLIRILKLVLPAAIGVVLAWLGYRRVTDAGPSMGAMHASSSPNGVIGRIKGTGGL